MKVSIPGRKLVAAVKAAGAVSKPEDDRQILRNILLVATDTGLEVTATDTTVGLWLHIPVGNGVQIHAEGRVAVNAQQLQRVLNSVSNKDVTISATPKGFVVSGRGSRHRLSVEDANEFPKVMRFSKHKPYITVPSHIVPKMVNRTAFCAHTEASFFLMHGLLVKAKDNELRMVATNGQRLAVATAAFDQQSHPEQPFDEELVIPAELAIKIKQIIDTDVKTIDVQWMANFLNVRTDLGEVSIRALAGDFPDYSRGIPSQLRTMTLDRQEFIEILKQTTALKSPTTNFVALAIKGEQMTFSSQVDGIGDAVVEYEVKWEHEDLDLTINPDFMLDTLTTANGDFIDLELGTAMTPTLLRERDNKELNNFCVFAVVRQ